MAKLKFPHLILTVKDFETNRDFYKHLYIDFLGCTIKIDHSGFFYFCINEDDDISLGIGAENSEFEKDTFNRYRVGLHHFAVELETRESVNKTCGKVQELGGQILDYPQVFKDYDKNYYAFFYLDPSGMKHEFVTFEEVD